MNAEIFTEPLSPNTHLFHKSQCISFIMKLIFHNEHYYILIVLGFLQNTLLCFAFLCQKSYNLFKLKQKGEYLCCTKIFLNSPAFETDAMSKIKLTATLGCKTKLVQRIFKNT